MSTDVKMEDSVEQPNAKSEQNLWNIPVSKVEENTMTSSEPPKFGQGIKPEDLNPENFRDLALGVLSEIIDYYGGPLRYLEVQLDTAEKRADFAEALKLTFPPKPNAEYRGQSNPGVPLPRNSTDTFAVHLADLGFGAGCSPKPAPFAVTSKALIDEFLTHGFVSSSSLTHNFAAKCLNTDL